MTLLVLVVVYLMLQYDYGTAQIHQDAWYSRWGQWLNNLNIASAETRVALQVLLPALVVLIGLVLVGRIASLLVMLLAIPLLFYCVGRREITQQVQQYIAAYRKDDNVAATEIAAELGVDVEATDNWEDLNRAVLRTAAYQGFERLFAVMFWFVFLGPVCAFIYRLLCLTRDDLSLAEDGRMVAARGAWLMEWPAVRMLGLSFALTGNFVGCFSYWKQRLLEVKSSTQDVLEVFVHGALNLNASQDIEQQDIGEQDIEALMPLLTRTLVLWLVAVAIYTLIG